MSHIGPRRFELARLIAVVALWAGAFHGLSRFGVDLLPRAFARELTLEAYLALVHMATLALGLTASFVLLGEPRRVLALAAPRPAALGYVLALVPAVFVVATGAAFQIAKPTLLAELAHGGLAEVQKNTGEFGRELTGAPSWLAFAWGALVSPVSEEFFFRGAVFAVVLDATSFLRATKGESALSAELLDEGALTRATRATVAWLKRGGAATLLVALVFGLLHHDMPGGLGIVRFVSALGLGIACGLARQASASIAAPILVHVAFNALSLATARRLLVSEMFPMKAGVPTLVAVVAVAATWAVAVVYLLSSRGKRA